jgi:hypothetical protein
MRVVELVVSIFVATLVTLPILSYIVAFIVAKQWTNNHRRSVQIAMDVSTVFFISSVHFLIIEIWDKHLLWLIMLIVLVLGCCVVLVHYKVKQEIIFGKVLKGVWRLNFACFSFVYCLLFFYGVIARILTTVTV